MTRPSKLAAILFVAAVAAAACSSSGGSSTLSSAGSASAQPTGNAAWQQVVAKADSEGSVTAYLSGDPAVSQALEQAFEQAYPKIHLNVLDSDAATQESKIAAERSSGNHYADLAVTTDYAWVSAHPSYFTPVTGPNFAAAAYDPATNLEDGKEVFRIAYSVLGFAWNTQLFPQGLKDYSDLLNPKLEGKIGLFVPTGAVVDDYYSWMQTHYGQDFLEKIGQLKPRLYTGAPAIIAALQSGEIAATPYALPFTSSQEQGAPIQWGTSATESWGADFIGTVLSTAPHPAAAQVLANFIVSNQGQAAYGVKFKPVIAGVKSIVNVNPKVDLPNLADWPPAKANAYEAQWKAWMS